MAAIANPVTAAISGFKAVDDIYRQHEQDRLRQEKWQAEQDWADRKFGLEKNRAKAAIAANNAQTAARRKETSLKDDKFSLNKDKAAAAIAAQNARTAATNKELSQADQKLALQRAETQAAIDARNAQTDARRMQLGQAERKQKEANARRTLASIHEKLMSDRPELTVDERDFLLRNDLDEAADPVQRAQMIGLLRNISDGNFRDERNIPWLNSIYRNRIRDPLVGKSVNKSGHSGTIVDAKVADVVPAPGADGKFIPEIAVTYDKGDGTKGVYTAPLTEFRSTDEQADPNVKPLYIGDLMKNLAAKIEVGRSLDNSRLRAAHLKHGGDAAALRTPQQRAQLGMSDEARQIDELQGLGVPLDKTTIKDVYGVSPDGMGKNEFFQKIHDSVLRAGLEPKAAHKQAIKVTRRAYGEAPTISEAAIARALGIGESGAGEQGAPQQAESPLPNNATALDVLKAAGGNLMFKSPLEAMGMADQFLSDDPKTSSGS